MNSPQSKLPNAKGGLGGDLNPSTAVTSELWAPKSRGPPPGLSAKSGSTVNGWSTNISSGTSSQWAPQRNNWGGSPWLLLRNLTAQVCKFLQFKFNFYLSISIFRLMDLLYAHCACNMDLYTVSTYTYAKDLLLQNIQLAKKLVK